ncbi:hypothetical protein SGFS_023740 [Streptomyces graminofaciens]|uniref:Uncharacterized protein n=1 Tax=Streptomyces graminofaciens TaxID=68212 RepID=A0ABN5VDK8_9ACTN|nr:hypothetical protein SGFS_023740 [Streptomyces graminofaciens]
MELGLGIAQEGEQETVTVTGPEEQRALSHAGGLGDGLHRHVLGPPLRHQSGGRRQ